MNKLRERSWTEIDLSAYEHNINQLRKFLPKKVQIMQIIKADAYGHGALEIAEKAIQCGINFFGVANADEGALLRFQGISQPILILSPSFTDEIPVILENNLIPTISEISFAEELNKQSEVPVSIQINIDTGMGRSGIDYKDLPDFFSKLKPLHQLNLDGIFSHYSSSEDDVEFSNSQKHKFQEIINKLKIKPKHIHISNSSAVITCSDNVSNLVRIGLLSYGIYSDKALKDKVNLKPVMTFKTRISQLKIAQKGDPIGYNRTYFAQKKIKYAVLPVGYADGPDFQLSNKGKVYLRNNVCNIIGKISMDMMTIDITDVPNVQLSDVVTIIGDAHEDIKAENQVKLYNGSSYELLCQIGRRAKRYYFDLEKIVSSSPLLRRDFFSKDHTDSKLTTIIESALEQRLQSRETAELISKNILNRFFAEKDEEISYRKNFKHTIRFNGVTNFPEIPNEEFYITDTELTFTKVLQNDFFYIACAKSENDLEKYFLRNDVEYRWLLSNQFDLNERFFKVTSVKINNTELNHTMNISDGSIETKCSHKDLTELVGTEVEFSICTKTFYPKSLNQLSVYITEVTQGVNIDFIHNLNAVEAVPIFSGQKKFPTITYMKNAVLVNSKKDEWIFPNSGVVFVY
jgi:alanine racemase